MTLQPKGISQCECDVWSDTCSDCFIRFRMKPQCTNCHTAHAECKCGNTTEPWLRGGWDDNTKYIVKHTEAEKNTIRGWEEDRRKYMQKATDFYDQVWEVKECRECNKGFKVRGGRLSTCKACTRKIINDKDKYSEDLDGTGVKRNF